MPTSLGFLIPSSINHHSSSGFNFTRMSTTFSKLLGAKILVSLQDLLIQSRGWILFLWKNNPKWAYHSLSNFMSQPSWSRTSESSPAYPPVDLPDRRLRFLLLLCGTVPVSPFLLIILAPNDFWVTWLQVSPQSLPVVYYSKYQTVISWRKILLVFAKFAESPGSFLQGTVTSDRSNSAGNTTPKSHWLHGTKIYFFAQAGFNSGQVALLSISSPVKDSRILDFFPCLIIVSEHSFQDSMKEKSRLEDGRRCFLPSRVTNGLIIFIHIPSVLNLSAEEARQCILSVCSER